MLIAVSVVPLASSFLTLTSRRTTMSASAAIPAAANANIVLWVRARRNLPETLSVAPIRRRISARTSVSVCSAGTYGTEHLTGCTQEAFALRRHRVHSAPKAGCTRNRCHCSPSSCRSINAPSARAASR
jgi:hypothetical protein